MSDRKRWLKRGLAVTIAAAAAAVGLATPAQAAVPDAFGFALWDDTTGTVVPSGTTPAGTVVIPGVPGRYRVIFPGLGGRGGVVHVTAVNPRPHYCQVDGFGVSGVDQLVGVSCYVPFGVLDRSSFTIQYSRSTHPAVVAPGQFAYADVAPTGTVITGFNSSAGPFGATHVGVGIYLLRFSNLVSTSSPNGSWQATAVSPNVAARCKIARFWSGPNDQLAYVFCFNGAGAPFDTRFNVTFQRQRALYGSIAPPKYFGYLWHAPGGVPETNFNSQLGFNVNTVISAGLGLWLVVFPRLAQLPDDVQVTAFGTTSDFYGLNFPWRDIGGDVYVRDVNCFRNDGTPVNAGFLISYNSRF